MKEELYELPPDIQVLLEAEQTLDPVPAASIERVSAALATRISGPTPGLHLVTKALLVGVGLSLIAGVSLRNSSEATLTPLVTAKSSPTVFSLTTLSDAPSPPAKPPRVEQGSVANPSPVAAASTLTAETKEAFESPDDTLSAELKLLGVARATLQSDSAMAAGKLAEYVRAFGREGQLLEEYDALSIRLLLQQKQTEQAAEQLTRFTKAHPRSALADALAREVTIVRGAP